VGWLDRFLPQKKTDAVFGDLVYRGRAWNGTVSIPELDKGAIPLEIETASDSDLSVFRPMLTRLHQNIDRI
jgi:hypothetical protein